MENQNDRVSPLDLTARLDSLRARLDDGYHRIDAAQLAGEDVERWETFWIELLHQYEALCDGTEQAA